MTNESPDVTTATGDLDDAGVDAAYAYPPQLTDLILDRWREVQRATGRDLARPERDRLEAALSSCYQASLLREEGRPVTFRVALADLGAFGASAGPPTGLHRLAFELRRPLDQHELRRLSPAAAFSRSFIGASLDDEGGPKVWGLIHTGPQWLQSVRGGRETRQAIPPVLTIAVTGPGRLLVSAGAEPIAELRHGTLVAGRLDVFRASWMHELFRTFGEDARRAHLQACHQAPHVWADVDPAFAPSLARHVLRRVLATIRGAQHGGTLLIVPPTRVPEIVSGERSVQVKYGFSDEEPRRRLLTLTLRIMEELARVHSQGHPSPVGWREYETSDAATIVDLDEALFEVAHLIADLSQVDGAVVMTSHLDLLGFGAEITGRLPDIGRVARAADLEGTRRDWVRTDRVGTRHRSVYRLCHEARDVLALVVSQDGGLRFVRWCHDAVTYWDQVATGPWEV
jgi:hypothetical protein